MVLTSVLLISTYFYLFLLISTYNLVKVTYFYLFYIFQIQLKISRNKLLLSRLSKTKLL